MQIGTRAFDAIDVAFVEELVRDRIPESLTHDYKERLPDKRDDDARARLLKVIASFANASGGVVLLGVDSESDEWGIPGLRAFDPDKGVLGLEQLLRSGIEPPIPGVRFRILPRGDAPLLLVGVPRSLNGPHRTADKFGGRFPRRTHRGTEWMTVQELREAFLEADRWMLEAEGLHATRVDKVLGDAVGRPERVRKTGGLLMMHALPLGRLRDAWALPMPSVPPFVKPVPFSNAAWDSRPTLEGLRWIERTTRDSCPRWLIDFRHGGTEFGIELSQFTLETPNVEARIIGYRADELELTIATALRTMLERMEARGVAYPLAVMLSIHGVQNAPLRRRYRNIPPFMLVDMDSGKGFDRPLMTFPALAFVAPPTDLPADVRPLLEVLWQAAGEPGSPFFAADGVWELNDRFWSTEVHY